MSKDLLQNLIQKEIASKQRSGDEIKKLKSILKGLERISESNPEKVKDAIRISNRANLAPEVEQLTNICLQGANKMQYVSFPIEGNKKQPKAGLERDAINNLRLLNDFLIELKEVKRLKDQNEKDERIKENENKLSEKFPVLKDKIKDLLEGKKSINEKEFIPLIKQVSQNVTNLFWYPRIENPLDPKGQEWQKVENDRKYNKAAQPRDNALDKLYEVSARHLVLIFNCFKGFGEFDADGQKQITEGFLQNVIDQQEWNKEGVNKTTFIEMATKDKATLEYKSQIFYTKDSAKQAEIKKANEASTSQSH